MMGTGILVCSEQPELARELLGKARRVADVSRSQVSLLVSGEVTGNEVERYAANGADVIYSTDKRLSNSDEWTTALGLVITKAQPGLVLVGATKLGMESAPRVAERFQAAYAAWAVDFEIEPEDGSTTARCTLYAGVGLATYRFSQTMTILTAAQGAFEERELEGRVAHTKSVLIVNDSSDIKVISVSPKVAGNPRLPDARIVVDIGKGVKRIEDLETVRCLASLLDAQLGCSRPVSSDRDWLPDWLGLSGAKVKPALCLTIGISGAIQHMVGIRGSTVIAAVNNDENAAIFAQADIGVVADLTTFLPVLVRRLQERGASPA